MQNETYESKIVMTLAYMIESLNEQFTRSDVRAVFADDPSLIEDEKLIEIFDDILKYHAYIVPLCVGASGKFTTTDKCQKAVYWQFGRWWITDHSDYFASRSSAKEDTFLKCVKMLFERLSFESANLYFTATLNRLAKVHNKDISTRADTVKEWKGKFMQKLPIYRHSLSSYSPTFDELTHKEKMLCLFVYLAQTLDKTHDVNFDDYIEYLQDVNVDNLIEYLFLENGGNDRALFLSRLDAQAFCRKIIRDAVFHYIHHTHSRINADDPIDGVWRMNVKEENYGRRCRSMLIDAFTALDQILVMQTCLDDSNTHKIINAIVDGAFDRHERGYKIEQMFATRATYKQILLEGMDRSDVDIWHGYFDDGHGIGERAEEEEEVEDATPVLATLNTDSHILQHAREIKIKINALNIELRDIQKQLLDEACDQLRVALLAELGDSNE